MTSDLGRRPGATSSTRVMALATAGSRLSGFVRVVVFTSVFGKSFLSNTYLSANTVPNILFELFVAGALQAVLVPSMVRLLQGLGATDRVGVRSERGRVHGEPGRVHSEPGRVRSEENAEHAAGAVLGLVLAVMALLGLMLAVFGPVLMKLVLHRAPVATRSDQIELGSTLLVFFAPQLLFYALNLVSTAVLNARGEYAAAVFAPLLNNMVVIGAYGLFAVLHSGPMDLDLTVAELWTLGAGTTVAVAVFCLFPFWALTRSGFRLRPRWEPRHPVVIRLMSDGAWAGVFLGATQAVQFAVILIGGEVAGAIAAYGFAFVLFTLPHAIFAVPIMTTKFTPISASAARSEWHSVAELTSDGTRAILYTTLLSSAGLLAVAQPLAYLLTFGGGQANASSIAQGVLAFAPAVAGFGLLLFFTRVLYALGDSRTSALVNLGFSGIAILTMLTVFDQVPDGSIVWALALAVGAVQVGGAVALGSIVHLRLSSLGSPLEGILWPLARSLACAGCAGFAGWMSSQAVGWEDLTHRCLGVLIGGSVAGALYLVGNYLLGGPTPVSGITSFGEAQR